MTKEEMYKKIEDVAQKIGEKFHPEKIILFGSYAWGEPGPDSDVDLLVVIESNKTRIERQKELQAALFPRTLPIDLLVYTPAELEEQINKKRNLFLEDIIRNGVVLYSKKEGREINISNSGFIKNQEVRLLVNGYLSEKKGIIPRFSSILLVDAEEISALIGRKFPAAENIKVDKKFFHALEISLGQKEAVGIWCYEKEKQCLYFDRHGIAFDSVTQTSGTLLINVSDEKGQFEKLGELVVAGDLLNLVTQTAEQLKKTKIEALRFIVPAAEDFRLDVQTAEGWKIYLNIKDDLAKQFKSLEVFLAQKISPEKRSQLQYIDLTVPNRVYYK